MRLRDEVEGAGRFWPTLTFYGKFEHVVVLVLITLIALVIATATWHLTWNIIHLLILGILDPADPATFQTIFGMIFTVLIALEFKHSLLVVLERQDSVIQVRGIVLIAILALVRKFIILDLKSTPAIELFALATAILALGAVYWLVRDQDRREDMWRRRRTTRRPGPGLPSEPYPGAGVAGEDAHDRPSYRRGTGDSSFALNQHKLATGGDGEPYGSAGGPRMHSAP